MKIFTQVLFMLCFTTVLHAQIVTIPDINFKSKLLQSSSSNLIAKNLSGSYFKIDVNDDNEIQLSEALNVSFLQLSNNGGDEIQSLEGITSFLNLRTLYCWYNVLGNVNLDGLSNLVRVDCFESHITSLSLNGLTNLQTLNCYGNQMQTLDVQSLSSIVTLNCSSNQITSLNASNLSTLRTLSCGVNLLTSLSLNNLLNLRNLYCNYNDLETLDTNDLVVLNNFYCTGNNLTSLNLSNSTGLYDLQCDNNLLTSLNLNGLSNLHTLYCGNNQLQILDTSTLNNLADFRCYQNQLRIIDVGNMPYLNVLDCNFNDLRYLFLKNGISNYALDFLGNPNLSYVCIDDNVVYWIESRVSSYGYTNCSVNSYCSFVPGGEYFVINGTSTLDNDTNGCDNSDVIFPSLKINVTNGANSGSFISDTTGQYSIPVQQGTHTMTPVLENPSYFTISPTSFQVNFQTENGPYIQNFCITPNGVHNDLEVIIIPLSVARPGFDAFYSIVYKNKGNISLSGNLTLSFEDDKMDFMLSNPAVTSQAINLLSWDYSNLLPFESRIIEVKMNINSPTETTAVNVGNQLSFTSKIFPLTGDEFLPDNIRSLKQIVVGAIDPNDKTCLEGNLVGQEMIGEFVHYVIRFENTGTFAAENVVVKDVIDITKFDINSIFPINGSHPFITRINGNIVEFIFENINLPFDDSSNDGYVAFKIKTKSTLGVGDTFTNDANIYFDYNFPVLTNTASTTIQSLGNQDFEFADYFSLYPNPTNGILYIKNTNNTVVIYSLSIYNTLGQLLQVVSDPNDNIDVSRLRTGNYFIKIMTDKGTSSGRFVKK